MRIKNITLHNFGSYRGNNQFHFEVNRSGKRVVVIGGKNGAEACYGAFSEIWGAAVRRGFPH